MIWRPLVGLMRMYILHPVGFVYPTQLLWRDVLSVGVDLIRV